MAGGRRVSVHRLRAKYSTGLPPDSPFDEAQGRQAQEWRAANILRRCSGRSSSSTRARASRRRESGCAPRRRPCGAREAAATGAAVVFACGGDGTLNEVANGLVGSESTLGALRGGMGNVFAKEGGVPRSPEAALRLLVEGERRRIDLGVAGTGDGGQGRHFVLMAGVGFDAE